MMALKKRLEALEGPTTGGRWIAIYPVNGEKSGSVERYLEENGPNSITDEDHVYVIRYEGPRPGEMSA